MSRKGEFGDTGGSYPLPDVLASWAEQLTTQKLEGGRQRRWVRSFRAQEQQEVAADRAAADNAARWPIPPFVKSIFCQQEACVLTKCSEWDKKAHCPAADCDRHGDGSSECRGMPKQCCPSVQPPRHGYLDAVRAVDPTELLFEKPATAVVRMAKVTQSTRQASHDKARKKASLMRRAELPHRE